MSDTRSLSAEWIKKAEEDELSLDPVLKDGSASTACFLSQQMAEKYLKAFLVSQRIEFPKTHDLLTLLSLMALRTEETQKLKEDLQLLNRYAVEPRYPTDLPEVTRRDAEEAAGSARRVKETILARMKSR